MQHFDLLTQGLVQLTRLRERCRTFIRPADRGTRIKTVINGVTIADDDGAGRLDDETHRARNVGMKGHIGLQIHPGNELLIRLKDIEVRPP